MKYTVVTLPAEPNKSRELVAFFDREGQPLDFSTGGIAEDDPRLQVSYIWDEVEEEYLPIGGIEASANQPKSFLGPVNPATVGFTMNPGDTWDSTVVE